MKIFDKSGKLNTEQLEYTPSTIKQPVLVRHLYCQHGHEVISPRVTFNGESGILLQAVIEDSQGMIGLSPVFGDDSRIILDIRLVNNGIYKFLCPECHEELKVFSECVCGAPRITLFLDQSLDINKCVCICSRYGCKESRIISSDDILNTLNIL